MSRTDEVRGRGRERGGSGAGGAPFVRWGDSYAWVEGRVAGSFSTKYGLAVTIDLSNVGGAPLEAQGRDEEGADFTVGIKSGMRVNVGTQSTTLTGKITAEDEGKNFHVAFEGWEEPKGGNRYRVFSVIELTERDAPEEDADEEEEEYARGGAVADDLPFGPLRLTEPIF